MTTRYNRNTLIKDFGPKGQQKLKDSKVLVVGAGGLGSPVLLYLAAAGIGILGIIDHDQVDISNLQRQIIHFTTDIGISKVESAAEKLQAINPEIQLNLYKEKLTNGNAELIIQEYDFIVECCDNYTTKFLVNDVCVRLRKPYSHGAVIDLRGEVLTYIPGHACYRCVFDNPPADREAPISSEIGVLGSVAGIIGSIQATESIKYLTGIGNLLTDRLLILNGRDMTFSTLKIKPDPTCNHAISGNVLNS